MRYKNYESIKEIDYYFNEVKNTQPLSREEERELSKKIQEGDKASLDKLVTANLKYVISVAKTYRDSGVPFGDLVAEGNLGLIRAAEKFDGTKGIKFISYAVWWIRASIKECIAKYRPNKDDFDVDDYVFKSLTEDCWDDSCVINEEYEDKLADIKTMGNSLSVLFDVLKEREIKILKMYYGLDNKEMTLDEIGAEMHLTNERVRQIKQKAMDKLRVAALTNIEYDELKNLY